MPVSVDYQTIGSTASSAAGDFTAVSGKVHFAPGETSQTIRVPVLADIHDEVGETLIVHLSNPRHALLGLPTQIQLSDLQMVTTNELVEVAVALPGLVRGTVDWGDGTIEQVVLTDQSERVMIEASHRYTISGVFQVVVTMTHSLGKQIGGFRSVRVEEYRTIPPVLFRQFNRSG